MIFKILVVTLLAFISFELLALLGLLFMAAGGKSGGNKADGMG